MESDDLKHSYYLRAIRTSIGTALREQYKVDEPLTERLTELLRELDEVEGEARSKRVSENEPSKPTKGSSRTR